MAQAKEVSTLLPPPVFSLHAPTGDAFDFEPLLTKAMAPLRRRATIKRLTMKCTFTAALTRPYPPRPPFLRPTHTRLSHTLACTPPGATTTSTTPPTPSTHPAPHH